MLHQYICHDAGNKVHLRDTVGHVTEICIVMSLWLCLNLNIQIKLELIS